MNFRWSNTARCEIVIKISDYLLIIARDKWILVEKNEIFFSFCIFLEKKRNVIIKFAQK